MRIADRVHPVVLLLTGIVSVQIASALATSLIAQVGAGGAVVLRVGLACVALLALARPRLRGHSLQGWATIAAYGLALGLMNFFFYQAIERLPIGVAVTIEFLGPLVVAVITSHRGRDLLATLVAAAGVVLMASASGVDAAGLGALDHAGVVYALLAAFCWGVYIPIATRAGAEFPRLEGLALAMLVSTVAVLPFGVSSMPQWTWAALGAGCVVALMGSLVPYSVELVALRRLSSSTFGVLCSLEPVVAAVSGFIILGQRLAVTQLVGMGLVVAASSTVLGGSSPEMDQPVPMDGLIHTD